MADSFRGSVVLIILALALSACALSHGLRADGGPPGAIGGGAVTDGGISGDAGFAWTTATTPLAAVTRPSRAASAGAAP